jgi:hypothetical protein
VTDVPRSAAGYTVVHVISDAWGPFVDIRASFQSLARRRRHHVVITPDEFRQRQNDWLWNDPRTVFVLWELIDPGPKVLRKCKVVHVYAEAMDDSTHLMLPDHLRHWNAMKTMAVHFDAILTHTPWTAEFVRKHVQCPAYVYPAGYDVEVMGTPRWEAPKFTKLVYHGSSVGRREMIVPYLRSYFGADFIDATGTFGRALLGRMDTSMASIYIGHSGVHSFSTWRAWQCASTSCALIAEVGTDTWPMIAGKHFLPLTWFSLENGEALRELAHYADDAQACRLVAQAAHEEVARKFTLEYVEDKYLWPMLEKEMYYP